MNKLERRILYCLVGIQLAQTVIELLERFA